MTDQRIRPALGALAGATLVGLGLFALLLVGAFDGDPAPGTGDRQRLGTAPRGHVRAAERSGVARGPRRAPRPFDDAAGARRHDVEMDPQERASRRFLARSLDMGTVPGPATHRLELVAAEGGLGLTPGDLCTLRMLPVLAAGFDCLVAVRCGDRVLYPDPELGAGYARCVGDGFDLRIDDGFGTLADGDPRLHVDLRVGEVEVADDGPGAFRVELRRLASLPRI
ncbi:MAG: hypothetical protein AAF447_01200 [Myxococcota bacterium]